MIFVYVAKKRHAYYILLILCITLILSSYILKFNIQSALLTWCILAISSGGIKILKDFLDFNRITAKEALLERKNNFTNIKKEDGKIIDHKRILDNKSFSLGSIYEVIKKMSEALRTDDIIRMLSVFLNENFEYSECYIAILNQDAEEGALEKIFEIKKSDSSFKEVNIDSIDNWKADLINSLRQMECTQVVNKENIYAIPLFVERMMIAVLFISDMNKEHLENFLILASQLALELKKTILYESVEKLSITDGLTEIYLRRYFIDRLSEEIERSQRLNLRFSILMIDIDHFKRCNDDYGHMVGDAVLKEIANTIKANVREIDLAARHGGEEFVVLLPETGGDGAIYVAQRIRKAMENRIITAYDESLSLTVSIGISLFPEHGVKPASLIEKADQAMYLSKEKGRNTVTLYGG